MSEDNLDDLRKQMARKFLTKTSAERIPYKRSAEGERAYKEAREARLETEAVKDQLRLIIKDDRSFVQDRSERERINIRIRQEAVPRRPSRPKDAIACRCPDGQVKFIEHFEGMTVHDLFAALELDPLGLILCIPGSRLDIDAVERSNCTLSSFGIIAASSLIIRREGEHQARGNNSFLPRPTRQHPEQEAETEEEHSDEEEDDDEHVEDDPVPPVRQVHDDIAFMR